MNWYYGYTPPYVYPCGPIPLRASVVPVGAPEAELFTLDAAKRFSRVTTTADDDTLTGLIIDARVHAERHTHRSLVKKNYLMSLSRFPSQFWDRTQLINLWYPPLVGDVSIKYIDSDGNEQTLISGTDFQVDFAGEPGRVAPIAAETWPQTKFGALNAVRIFYKAGYEANSSLRLAADAIETDIEEPETEQVQVDGEAQVNEWIIDRTIPADLAKATLQLVEYWYRNRGPVNAIPGAGGSYNVLPWHLEKVFNDHTFDTLTPTITPEY